MSKKCLNDTKIIFTKEERKSIKLFQKEWETVIKTQMHFNDIIIRFRAITITSFVTVIGAVFAIYKTTKIDQFSIIILILFAIVFWVSAGLLDFLYYQKMLIASVEHAKKFDNDEFFRSKNLFGLTEIINNKVSNCRTNVLLLFFYLVPLMIAIFILCTLSK